MRRFIVVRTLNARLSIVPSGIASRARASSWTLSARAPRAADWIPEGRSRAPVDEPTHYV
jgi:hypothetical protein